MLRPISILTFILLLVAPVASSAQPAKVTPKVVFGTAPEWPEGQSTTVSGKIPDAAFGTWLIVENLDFTKDTALPALRLYRIKRGANGEPVSELLSFSMPVSVQDELEGFQSATRHWEPKPTDLPAILDAARKTAAINPELKVKNFLDSKEGMPANMARRDQELDKIYPGRKPTLFLIRYAAQEPSGALSSGEYFIEEATPGMLAGAAKVAAVPMNGAGLPVPLSFNGHAKFIRVDPPAAAAAATPATNAEPATTDKPAS